MDWDIVYPVILLGKDGLRLARDSEHLTTIPRSLLKAGVFDDQWLVDSTGRARHIKEGHLPAGSIGLMSRLRELWNWSYSIRMELVFDGEITFVSVDELKERLLVSLAGRPAFIAAWNPGFINFEQLKEGLKTAMTFDEVFRLVGEFDIIRPELL